MQRTLASHRGPGRSIAAALALSAIVQCWTPNAALAIDESHMRTARAMIANSIAYLRTQQDQATGGWAVPEQGPSLPAITGLVVKGMILDPSIDETDDAIRRGVAFLLSKRQPDGGIYDGILPSYNTSICLSALANIHTAEAAAVIKPAQAFLKSLQWGDGANASAAGTAKVNRSNPFYGGVGYGSHGRPDNSNLNLMLQALHDSGLSSEDPAFARALIFLQRTQMHHLVNDMPYAAGSTQGGFIYATGPEKDQPDIGESKAGTIEETLDDGSRVSRLRAYGSMTYAGFKSYIYANLSRDDTRVQLAYDWIRRNYTLAENPGLGTNGYYYFLVTFARAMEAWGLPTIETFDANGHDTTRDWADDLVDALAKMQNEDGSFRPVDDRWMENNPVLITAFALLALQDAVH